MKQSTNPTDINKDIRRGSCSVSTAIYADIVFCGDRSGSMQTMEDSVFKGLIEFIKDQKSILSEQGIEGCLTVCAFDHEMKEIHFQNIQKEDITECKTDEYKKDFKPRGTTRLVDTAIEQLFNQHKRIEKYKKNLPKEVQKLDPEVYSIFALLTDGVDNESDSSVKDLNLAVRKANKEGTTCIFMGANQDAIQNGELYGFNPGLSLNIGNTPTSAINAMKSCSQVANRSLSGNVPSFTKAERCSSAPIDNSTHSHNYKVFRPPTICTGNKFNPPPPPCKAERSDTFCQSFGVNYII